MYRTVINLEFFKIPSMSGFRNRNIDTRSRQYIAEAGCQWKKVKSTKKKKEKGSTGEKGEIWKRKHDRKAGGQRDRRINSRWNSHFRLLVIFGHVRRFFTITGYRISARFPARCYFNDFAVFQSWISMVELAVPVNFSTSPFTLHRFSPFFLWAEFCAELSPFVFGSRRHRRKWCVSVPSKACHFRTKNPKRFHKSFPPLQR